MFCETATTAGRPVNIAIINKIILTLFITIVKLVKPHGFQMTFCIILKIILLDNCNNYKQKRNDINILPNYFDFVNNEDFL